MINQSVSSEVQKLTFEVANCVTNSKALSEIKRKKIVQV